jgi:hypothetical protein
MKYEKAASAANAVCKSIATVSSSQVELSATFRERKGPNKSLVFTDFFKIKIVLSFGH